VNPETDISKEMMFQTLRGELSGIRLSSKKRDR